MADELGKEDESTIHICVLSAVVHHLYNKLFFAVNQGSTPETPNAANVLPPIYTRLAVIMMAWYNLCPMKGLAMVLSCLEITG